MSAVSVDAMKSSGKTVGDGIIASSIVLLLLASFVPIFDNSSSRNADYLDDSTIFTSGSSDVSYNLYLDSSTSTSGGDGSISTITPEGSSEELSVLSTVEFFTNEMISDLQVYGEANDLAELGIYLKFEGNEGATADINFKLKSGTETIDTYLLELENACDGGGGWPPGGGTCAYAYNSINFEINENGFTVENGKKLGIEIDATIDGCQGGDFGGGGNCDVMVQFGEIDSSGTFSKLEVKANALSQSEVKVHRPGSGWTDSEVLEWIDWCYNNVRIEGYYYDYMPYLINYSTLL